tara:strand:- start:1169 stop:1561 length:393 start_codon:yes stop_codon:yes gene_type:complete
MKVNKDCRDYFISDKILYKTITSSTDEDDSIYGHKCKECLSSLMFNYLKRGCPNICRGCMTETHGYRSHFSFVRVKDIRKEILKRNNNFLPKVKIYMNITSCIQRESFFFFDGKSYISQRKFSKILKQFY